MTISKVECFGGLCHGTYTKVPLDRLNHNGRWGVYIPGEVPEVFDPTNTFEIETYIITELMTKGRRAGFILRHESWSLEKALVEINARSAAQREKPVKWKGWY